MSQTVQCVDFKQLLAQQGDASSLSEAELGRLKKQYEKLRKEWARKRRKLEKLDRAARAKQHVRRKLQEQQLQTGGAADTSPIQHQGCGRGDAPVIQGQLLPGGCPKDGDNSEEPTREGKVVHHQQEDHTAVDFTCGKSVSFSLDIGPDVENTQHEHPAMFESCTLSTVSTSDETALKSTDKRKVCNVPKAGDVARQGTWQVSSKSNSLATFPVIDENSSQSENSTSGKWDSNDATVQEEDVTIVQECSVTLGLGHASACIQEELGENEYDRNVSEEEEHTVLHFGDAVQDTRNRKPLFKGPFRQTIQNENLDETARHNEQKVSIQTQGEDLNTTKEKPPRNSSTCSDLDLSVEYVDDNLSQCRVPESSYCEGQMPDQQSQLPLTNTTIVLDSEEDETDCVDKLHLSHGIPQKSLTKQKENSGIISVKKNTKPSSLDTLSQRNVTELTPGQETLEEGNDDKKMVSKDSEELSSDFHEEDNSQIVEPSQGNFSKNTWVDGLMFPAEYYVRTTRRMQRQGMTPEGVARQVKARTTQRKQKRKVDSNDDGALEGSGGKKQEAKLDVTGTSGAKQAKLDVTGTSGAISSGVEVGKSSALSLNDAKDYKALAKEDGKSTMQRKQKRKVDSNDDGAFDATGGKKQAKLAVTGISAAISSAVEEGKICEGVVQDTQYNPSKSCFPLKDFPKGLKDLPKDLICEGVAQDKLQVLRKGRKSSSTHNTPEESLNNLPLICEGGVQDTLQVLRKGRKAVSTHNTPVQSSGLRRLVKGRKKTRSCQNSPVQTGCSSVLEGVGESIQDCSQVVEGDGLCRRSRRLKNRFSQGEQNSTSQEQTIQASKAQPESEFLKGDPNNKKETQKFFPVLSDQLRVKLSHSEATEFHLPYSDYGTLKVAKAREAPSADVGKKCSSRSSNGMDAKDVSMPSKEACVKYKNENQPILLTAERSSMTNKNLNVPSSLLYKRNSPNPGSKTKDASMPSKESSVNYKKGDQPLPISAKSLSPLRSNRNLDVTSTLSSCKGNSPNIGSKTELGEEKSRNLFPSLSPMLHKKCTEAVLDFSLVGTEYVKLKLNKVKSSPQPATATSSCGPNSRHRKDRQSMSKAKGNLQASSCKSKNHAKETNCSLKQPSEANVVQNREQQKVHDAIQEKVSKVRKEDNLLQNNNKNEFSRTTSPDTSVQPSLGSEVGVSDSGIQAPSIGEEVGKSAMSCSSEEDQNAFSGVDRNKVGPVCENRKLPVTASTKPLGPQNLVVSNCKSPCSKAVEMTLENNEMHICESEASQDTAAVVNKGTQREIPCSNYTEPICQKMESCCKKPTEISHQENNEMHICESQVSQDTAAIVDEGSTHREIPCPDYTEPISQKMETMKRVKITSQCFNGNISETGQTVVEETAEEGVMKRVSVLSTCFKATATREADVSVALGEARIHEEDTAVLAVCQNTTVSLWVWQGEDWTLGASWEIPEHEEVCDVFLLPCEVGVQVMVGGNFTSGFLKFFHCDGVSTSSQDYSLNEGVAFDVDGFHGDGCHGDSYHAMAVLPQAVAIATGSSNGGSSVWKVTMSSPAGHVEQQTRLPVPSTQRIGSLQQVEGCAGCLMGTGDNQVLLWNHSAGVLLRCVNLPGAHPTCLYAASAQGLLFAVVCSPDEEQCQDGCSLVAINPCTGCSLSLQKYQLPHGSSLARCTNGVMDGPRLLVMQDTGGLYLWDFFSGEMEAVLPGVSKKSSCVTTGK